MYFELSPKPTNVTFIGSDPSKLETAGTSGFEKFGTDSEQDCVKESKGEGLKDQIDGNNSYTLSWVFYRFNIKVEVVNLRIQSLFFYLY